MPSKAYFEEGARYRSFSRTLDSHGFSKVYFVFFSLEIRLSCQCRHQYGLQFELDSPLTSIPTTSLPSFTKVTFPVLGKVGEIIYTFPVLKLERLYTFPALGKVGGYIHF